MGRPRSGGKKILRSLLAQYIPNELFDRPKRGFSIPLAEWFRKDMRWLLEEYLSDAKIKNEGIFNAKIVNQLVKEHLGGKRDR